MGEITEGLKQNRAAVEELLVACGRVAPVWTAPRAPGKWSPAQEVEHVACALEQSANVIAGRPSDFPTIPAIFRPLLRGFFFNKIVKNGRFPGGFKTNKPLNPATAPRVAPATPAAARPRLEGALEQLEQAARGKGTGETRVNTTSFGWVTLYDYVVFQAIHTRHHCRLLPAGS